MWGTEGCQFYGFVDLRGGDNSGNGGLMEVSSHGNVVLRGLANRLAPNGKSGLLYIDPYNVTIQTPVATTGMWDGVINYLPICATDPNLILNTDLETQLGLGDVTIDTSTGACAQVPGNILMTAAVAPGASGDLTLLATSAGAVITITAPLTLFTGAEITLTADGNVTTSGTAIISGSLGHFRATSNSADVNFGASVFGSNKCTVVAAVDVNIILVGASVGAVLSFGNETIDITAGQDVIIQGNTLGPAGIHSAERGIDIVCRDLLVGTTIAGLGDTTDILNTGSSDINITCSRDMLMTSRTDNLCRISIRNGDVNVISVGRNFIMTPGGITGGAARPPQCIILAENSPAVGNISIGDVTGVFSMIGGAAVDNSNDCVIQTREGNITIGTVAGPFTMIGGNASLCVIRTEPFNGGVRPFLSSGIISITTTGDMSMFGGTFQNPATFVVGAASDQWFDQTVIHNSLGALTVTTNNLLIQAGSAGFAGIANSEGFIPLGAITINCNDLTLEHTGGLPAFQTRAFIGDFLEVATININTTGNVSVLGGSTTSVTNGRRSSNIWTRLASMNLTVGGNLLLRSGPFTRSYALIGSSQGDLTANVTGNMTLDIVDGATALTRVGRV